MMGDVEVIRVGYMRSDRGKFRDWMYAASAFALMHEIEFFYFTPSKIDFETETILGKFWDIDKGCFIEKSTPFPYIVNNNRFKVPLGTQKKLMESGVVLTWVNLGGKLKVDEILRQSPIKKYLIDTFNCGDIDILDVIDQYKEVVVKPLDSLSGRRVYKISKLGDDIYAIHTKHETKEISRQDLLEYGNTFKRDGYIVQEYVDSRTASGNPFDIKFYLIRSGKNGTWNHLNPLPRLGSPLGVVSNVSAGGNALLFPDKFLKEEFGENWKDIKQEMKELVESVPEALQKGYDRTLNTLGLDIGIDKRTNKLKLFEVNGTINGTPNKMELAAELMHLYKQLYKEMQDGDQGLALKEKVTRYNQITDVFHHEKYGQIRKYIGDKKIIKLLTTVNGYPVKVIEKSAFRNNKKITKVTVGANVAKIQSRSFAGCKALKEVILPPGIEFIADDAFEGCSKLTMIGQKGSFAQEYARKHDIKFLNMNQYKRIKARRRIRRRLKLIIKK